jgi:tRNA(Ile)-lysidine synthase
VAHHADDLAETVLFRMIRGTGPEGLIGMRPVRGKIIRPLLALGKEDIYRHLAALGQDYVEDSSNRESDYSRNFIRHHILPDMKKLNPRATDHIYSLSQQLAGLFEYIGPEVSALCDSLIFKTGDGFGIRVCDLSGLSDYAKGEVARKLLFMTAGSEKDIGNVHVEQLLSLADKADGKQNDFPYGVVAVRKRGCLLLSRGKETCTSLRENPLEIPLPEFEEGKSFSVPLDEQRVLDFSYEVWKGQQIPKRDCIKYFDYDTIKVKLLCLRTRLSGDYFVFDEQGRHKRLSRYFIDSRIPAEDRDRQLLLAEGSHIIWILSGRISWACRITPDTRRVLVVKIHNKEEVPVG